MTRFKPVALVLVMLVTVSAIALAGPMYKSASDAIGANNDLFVSFDEVGAGAGPINYTVTAVAQATYCTTGTNESASFSVPTKHNNVTVTGQDTGLGAPAATGTGPLVSVKFSNVVLTDTNNNASTNLNTVSKTVGTCP
jgi:hypothetical protein